MDGRQHIANVNTSFRLLKMEKCADAKMTQEARIQAAENLTLLNTNENVNIPNEEPQKYAGKFHTSDSRNNTC